MSRSDRWCDDRFFILAVCAAALAVRLHLLVVSGFVVDSDEAIVGLMAKHILEGRGVPVFYYGQHYMGSFEAICASLSFLVFGVSTWALKLIPLIFSIFLIPAVYQLCLELSGRRTARIAALFFAVPPTGLVEWSSKARGGFIEILFLGALALLYLFRFYRAASGRNASAWLAATWVTLGLGWWINNQIIYFAAPAAVIVALRMMRPRAGSADAPTGRSRTAVISIAAFFAGSAPYWIYNIGHSFASLDMLGSSGARELPDHFNGLFSSALPILFGAKRFWHDEQLFPGSSLFAYVIYGTVFVCFIRDRSNKDEGEGRTALWWLFPGAFFGGLLIFSLSSFGHLYLAPRYLLPLYVFLIPFSAYVIARILSVRPLLGRVLAASIVFLNVASTYLGGISVPGEPLVYSGQRVVRDHSALISFLNRHGIDFVRTNYWIGYKLAFETGERIRFSMYQEPYKVRIPGYEAEARKRGNILSMPMVVVPAQAEIIREALRILKVGFEEDVVSGYSVFHEIKADVFADFREIPRTAYAVSTNTNEAQISSAVDGDLDTRWGTGKPQRPGMEVAIDFSEPTEVTRISLELGGFETDFPRRLRVDVEDASGSRRRLMTGDELFKVLYFIHESDCVDMPIPGGLYRKIILTQTGTDPVFDWSIAELKLFSP